MALWMGSGYADFYVRTEDWLLPRDDATSSELLVSTAGDTIWWSVGLALRTPLKRFEHVVCILLTYYPPLQISTIVDGPPPHNRQLPLLR